MKLTILLLTTAILQLSASTFAQKISLHEKNAPLTRIFEKIRLQTGYDFLVTESMLKDAKTVSIQIRNEDFLTALNKIFENQQLTFAIKSNSIIVKKKLSSGWSPLSVTEIAMDISGRIVGEDGKPIPGATVKVKGEKQGTISDEDGRFKIRNVNSGSILVITYLGYIAKEVTASSGSEMTITLIASTSGLEEVVVVGYGTQSRKDITGAISTANLKTYEHVAVNNILESVKGTVPGLNVGSTNTAGQLASISIRGQNSINAGSSPLIVVDGAIFRGTLNDIPAADIESFTVLKDASAAAVYGSRSANGVILIETKKGSGINGKPKFDVNITQGISNELEHLAVYDGPGYIQRLLDIRQANGLEHDPAKVAIYLQNEEQKNYNATPDHKPTLVDPYSLFRQTGKTLNATLSISNRTDKTQYYISGNIIDQKGVIVNDVYKHYSGRVNLETDLTSWFKVGVKSYYSLKSYPGATIYGASGLGSGTYGFSPYASIYDAAGAYLQFPQSTTSFNSPYWQIPNDAYNRQNNLNGILTALIKVPWVKGLSYNLTYSNTLNFNETGSFYGLKTVSGSAKQGSGDEAYSRNYTTLLDHLLKYNKTFGKHSIDLTALYSTEDYTTIGMNAHGEGFDDPSLGVFGLGKGKIQTVGTSGTKTSALGRMARVTYGYNNTYTITGTIRQDGFSAFSENHKYGTFPSVGVNWNISNEKFMQHIGAIDRMSLRASYGSNGNQSISPYGTLGKMLTGRYFYEGSSSYVPTQYVGNLGNSDLKWESTIGVNLGLDFSVLKNRINGSIDWYSKYTHNLIFPLALPSTSGFGSISTNLGKVGNKGVELNLSTINIDRSAFQWRSDIAFSLNRNKIVTIYGKDATGVEKDLISQGYFIGKSLGTIYGYQVTGMWQQADADQGTIMKGMIPGSYKLLDVDGDGKITSDKDRIFLGNSNPNFRWSFTNTFQYKDLSLMVYLYSIWGGHGYYQSGSNTPYNDGYANSGAINHAIYDYWTPENPGAMFPRPNYSVAAYKGVKYFDRSFIKLQKMSISYNLTKLVKRYGIQGMTLSFSADNLFTYAPDWIGMDPETNSGLTDSSIPSIRTFMTGLSFNF
ncbi:TonB-dependent receptor [Pedobacter nyackensis]|uniref:TonB-dependent receptor n=1 Tax=Pedobacter nyackensis TaxID=475255 RepID=UPI002931C482|nr:TonB-dependent receptor [Pedobacter nyackensis]